LFALSIRWIPKSNFGFNLPVKLIIGSMLISLFLAFATWNQGFNYTFIATLPYLLWAFYFYLKKIKLSINIIEKVVILFGVIYSILYFIQLSIYPTLLFSFAEELSGTRGIDRIIFPGGGVFFLTVFIALSKLKNKEGKKWFWTIFLVLGIIIPILQVTRQYILALLLIYLFHFAKGTKLVYKIISISVFVAITFVFINSENKLVEGMVAEQQKNMQQGQEYTRILTAYYYLFEFSPKTINKVFGNGVPYGSKTEYGKYVNRLRDLYNYNYNDVGLIGIYAFWGILAVIGYILIFIKSFTLKLPTRYYYLKYYIWFLIVTSLTSSLLYYYHFLITTILVIYVFQTIIEIQVKHKNKTQITTLA